jgi:hypothetical protein
VVPYKPAIDIFARFWIRQPLNLISCIRYDHLYQMYLERLMKGLKGLNVSATPDVGCTVYTVQSTRLIPSRHKWNEFEQQILFRNSSMLLWEVSFKVEYDSRLGVGDIIEKNYRQPIYRNLSNYRQIIDIEFWEFGNYRKIIDIENCIQFHPINTIESIVLKTRKGPRWSTEKTNVRPIIFTKWYFKRSELNNKKETQFL